jgi:catechol 2,3-dioxygenase-like lactoylglutathione lyase family enzyme
MTSRVSPLVHIEIVVRDAEEAYRFLNRVFGTQKTQPKFAKFLDDVRLPDGSAVNRVLHVELGGVVLQFIQPVLEGTLWSDFLKDKGPGVHNLTFFVDSVEKAAKAFEEEGVPTLLTFPLDWARWAEFLPRGVTIRAGNPPVYMVGSEEKVGFRFELAESPTGQALPQSAIG